MKTVELFSGTGSFSKVAKKKGHSIFKVELNDYFEADLHKNILDVTLKDLPKNIDVLWASPPCTAFSVASIGRHCDKDTILPKTNNALLGIKMLEKSIELISEELKKNPDLIWFIENPRGMMRKVIDSLFDKYGLIPIRHTVTYCQYGDTRMKPTDICTNLEKWDSKPMCKNGAPCHVAAPRGSRTGTQGLKGNMERSVIPPALFEEIFEVINNES